MNRSRVGRGVAILAVAALAMAVVGPAFSAAPVTKAKVRKIAKKVAKKQINTLVPGMIDAATIGQGTIPAVTASTTDANKTVFTKGPFTVSLDCSLSAGNVNLQLLVKTSEENSVANDNYGNIQGDLDPGDGDVFFVNFTGNPPGGDAESEYSPYYGAIFLKSPSGTNIFLQFDQTTNFKGNHCYVDGWFLDLA
jgi:hypothetical protein